MINPQQIYRKFLPQRGSDMYEKWETEELHLEPTCSEKFFNTLWQKGQKTGRRHMKMERQH